MDALRTEMAALEARLADADLYRRDPAAFEGSVKTLDGVRAALAKAEDEWLALELLREELEDG
jgi:ATP-binding cassette subfamily F protein uup